MKETPMLFCGPMVRAILDGRKTVTRRLVKRQPNTFWGDVIPCTPFHPTLVDRDGDIYPGPEAFGFADDIEGWVFPYGRPGDLLWGKETFSESPKAKANHFPDTIYRADTQNWHGAVKWKPSIFMPRWASRLTLEILPGVRVERLQLITTEDCIAEGLTTNMRENDAAVDLRNQYRRLWNALNLDPKPIKAGGQIVRYEAYPWSTDDFAANHPDILIKSFNTKAMSCQAQYRGVHLDIYPDPYVWRIPFRKIATDKK